jgi:hypothetical protein
MWHDPPAAPPSAGLEKIVARLLQKDPEDRPKSATQLRAELEGLIVEMSLPTPLEKPSSPIAESTTEPAVPLATMQGALAAAPDATALALSTPMASAIQAAPAARPSRVLISAALLGLVAVGVTVELLKNRDDAPVAVARQSSNPNSNPDGESTSVEAQLGAALEKRGLAPGDLPLLDPRAVTAFEEAKRSGDAGKRASAGRVLLGLAATGSITPELLRQKLDRQDSALASLSNKVPAAKQKELEAQYLELYKAVRPGLVQQEYEQIARRATSFERELSRIHAGL